MLDQQIELLKEISKKLNVLILFEMSQEGGKRKLHEKVKFLLDLGFTNQQIAEILGTTKHSVEVIGSRLKRNGG